MLIRLLADDVHRCGRTSGQTASERCIVMDVEFEEVVEWIGDFGDGAVVVVFDAVVKGEGETGLVAYWEGDVF